MERARKRDEAYPREWNEQAADEFTSSDLLVLGDDGEQALFIPLTPAVRMSEQAFGGTRERMHVGVARVGDGELWTPDTWHVQDWPSGKRLFRRYKAIRSRHPEGFEGKVILRLVRDGVKNSQATVYHLEEVQAVTPDVADVVKVLTNEAFAG